MNSIAIKISRGAFTLFALSALLGGHLTASHLLLEPSYETLDVFTTTVAVTIGINALYFAVCIIASIIWSKARAVLIKSACGLLLNIPIAIIYLIILIKHEL